MILRRLAQSLKEQNWTAICVEFVLLVLGVFLGIQAANWNEGRADERLGRAYAQRLVADLAHDLATRRELVAYYAAVLDSVERTDGLLADASSDPMDLVVNAYRASELNFRAPSRSTWDAIVSSGDTGLLPQGVAAAVADYFSFDSAQVSVNILGESAYRRSVRMLIPLDVQKALREGCSDVRNVSENITGFMEHCSINADPEVIATTAAALRADPAVAEQLRYHYSHVVSAHINIQGDVKGIEQALAALGSSSLLTGGTP